MFKPSTTSVAKPVVDALYKAKLHLTPKASHLPVGVMSEHYSIKSEGTYKALSAEDQVALRIRFDEANKAQTELTADTFDELKDLIAHGVRRTVYIVRNVVVASCKEIGTLLENSTLDSTIPDIHIKPFNYHPIHQHDVLVEHITGGTYDDIRKLDSYRTFLLEYPGLSTIVEWAAANKHVDAEYTKQWFLESFDEDLVRWTFESLFGRDRTISLDGNFPYSVTKQPDRVDSLLLAYFITAYLRDQPQDPQGESVSLAEWEEALEYLHRALGSMVNHAYNRRVRDIRNGRVIFNTQLKVPEEGFSSGFCVGVNGDVYGEWLETGGDVKQILGAAVTESGYVTRDQLDQHREELITAWDRRHGLLKRTRETNIIRGRSRQIADMLSMWFRDSELASELPEITEEEVKTRAVQYLKGVKDERFEDMPRLIKDLFCVVFYPTDNFHEFLDIMDNAMDGGATSAREASLVAVVDLVARWLARQVDSRPIEYEIADEPTSAPEEAGEPEEDVASAK